jgi:nickel-type superoxide dismutase maturation protease
MRPMGRSLQLLIAVIGLLGIAGLRRLDVVEVRGRSMAPTLLPGDRLLVARSGGRFRVGDVVLAPDPRNPARELVKRVRAMDGRGVMLRGDNPALSTDARTFGAVPPDRVRWRVMMRIWPPSRTGPLAQPAELDRLDEGGEPACAVPESLIAG